MPQYTRGYGYGTAKYTTSKSLLNGQQCLAFFVWVNVKHALHTNPFATDPISATR